MPLELADAIVAQPIAVRVLVNRVWKGHFGTGLVDTPSNFGVAGERPTHPELLDYLAQYFLDHKMSIKALHKEIMRSAAYQLGTDHNQAAFDKDAGRFTLTVPGQGVFGMKGQLTEILGVPAEKIRIRSYNVGGSAERRNIDVVKTICSLLDERRPQGAPHDRLIGFVTDRPGHDLRYAIDTSKIASALAWSAHETFDTGLARTVDWYLANEPWWRRLRASVYDGRRLGQTATKST